MFFIAYFILSESNSSVKNNFHLRGQRLLSLTKGGIFSNVVICSLNTFKSMKTGSTYLNTTEKT